MNDMTGRVNQLTSQADEETSELHTSLKALETQHPLDDGTLMSLVRYKCSLEKSTNSQVERNSHVCKTDPGLF
jgi:hypothetical protein